MQPILVVVGGLIALAGLCLPSKKKEAASALSISSAAPGTSGTSPAPAPTDPLQGAAGEVKP